MNKTGINLLEIMDEETVRAIYDRVRVEHESGAELPSWESVEPGARASVVHLAELALDAFADRYARAVAPTMETLGRIAFLTGAMRPAPGVEVPRADAESVWEKRMDAFGRETFVHVAEAVTLRVALVAHAAARGAPAGIADYVVTPEDYGGVFNLKCDLDEARRAMAQVRSEYPEAFDGGAFVGRPEWVPPQHFTGRNEAAEYAGWALFVAARKVGGVAAENSSEAWEGLPAETCARWIAAARDAGLIYAKKRPMPDSAAEAVEAADDFGGAVEATEGEAAPEEYPGVTNPVRAALVRVLDAARANAVGAALSALESVGGVGYDDMRWFSEESDRLPMPGRLIAQTLNATMRLMARNADDAELVRAAGKHAGN